MGRRRQDGRKVHSKSHKSFSKLMPAGFNFGDDGVMLKYVEKTRVRCALKSYTRSMDRGSIDLYLSRLINRGVALIDYVGRDPPSAFWHSIDKKLHWSGGLSGFSIFRLVVVLVQAHEAFESNPPPHHHPNRRSSTAKEVHEFSRLLKEKYADNSEILDLYFSPIEGEGDEGSDTDRSLAFPDELSKEEIEKEEAWQDHYQDLVPEVSSSEEESSESDDDYDADDEGEGPSAYKPDAKARLAAKYEARVMALYDRDEEDDEEEQRLLKVQQELFAESRARQNPGAAPTYSQEMEVDGSDGGEGASKPLAEEAGSQTGGQPQRTTAGKRAREEDEDEDEDEDAEALGAAPKRLRGPREYEVDVEELVETMRDTGF